MGRWDETEDQDFIVTTLTTDFDDNKQIALVPQVQQFILYIDYTKGTETSLEIKIEYAPAHTDPKEFYQETLMDIQAQTVNVYVFKIGASGKFRIPIPVGIQEDQLKVSVRGVGTPTGTLTLDFSVDQYLAAPLP